MEINTPQGILKLFGLQDVLSINFKIIKYPSISCDILSLNDDKASLECFSHSNNAQVGLKLMPYLKKQPDFFEQKSLVLFSLEFPNDETNSKATNIKFGANQLDLGQIKPMIGAKSKRRRNFLLFDKRGKLVARIKRIRRRGYDRKRVYKIIQNDGRCAGTIEKLIRNSNKDGNCFLLKFSDYLCLAARQSNCASLIKFLALTGFLTLEILRMRRKISKSGKNFIIGRKFKIGLLRKKLRNVFKSKSNKTQTEQKNKVWSSIKLTKKKIGLNYKKKFSYKYF